MISISVFPPMNPETNPIKTPIDKEILTATSPTINEIWPHKYFLIVNLCQDHLFQTNDQSLAVAESNKCCIHSIWINGKKGIRIAKVEISPRNATESRFRCHDFPSFDFLEILGPHKRMIGQPIDFQ